MSRFWIGCALVLLSSSLLAQQRYTASYSEEPLADVLDQMGSLYAISFNYSPDFVAVDQVVSVSFQAATLPEALNVLSDEANVKYAIIGHQVALRDAPEKIERGTPKLSMLLPKPEQMSPIYPEQERRLPRPYQRARPIDTRDVKQLPGGNRFEEMDPEIFKIAVPDPDAMTGDARLSQISLLPYLGTNFLDSDQVVNKRSVNLLWGVNGGVNGWEVGVGANTIRDDVKGTQVAGLLNRVGGDVTGTQVAGIANINNGHTEGVQVAGLYNKTGSANAVQASFLYNRTIEDFTGIQLAGLYNISGGEADGIQLASLYNTAEASAKTQMSLFYNRADTVSWGQVGLMYNRAETVDGFQLALVNRADTVGGFSLGLFNFVKKGYNRLELGATETMYVNLMYKFGTHKWYSMLFMGFRWDNSADRNSGDLSWNVGYGLGTTARLDERSLLNFELLASHVNEKEVWTDELHLLTQFRLLYDYQLGRDLSVYLGPTANLMYSRFQQEENGEVGSSFVPANNTDVLGNGVNRRFWVGFTGGFRF